MKPDHPSLETTLDALRVRMKVASAVELAVRWAFYASILACGCLAAAKFGLGSPAWAAPLLLFPLIAAALARSTTRFGAAIALDRALGLEERVTTAIESGRDFVVRDAERALEGRDPRRAAPVALPREARFLAFTLPLAAALLVIALPGLAAEREPSDLARLAATLARRLEAVPFPLDLAADAKAVLADLRSGDDARIRAALPALSAIEAKLAKALLDGASGAEAKALRDAAEHVAAAGAALGRLSGGIDVVPGILAEKMNRAASTSAGDRSGTPGAAIARRTAPPGAPLALAAAKSAASYYNEHEWSPEYDDLVRAYYEVKR